MSDTMSGPAIVIENTEVTNSKDNIWTKFKTLVRNHIKPKEYSAKDAYLVSKYGINAVLKDDERYHKLIKSINETIDYKLGLGEYHCTRYIPQDMQKFKEDIIKHYTELGFTCIMLNEKIKEITDSILFISWANKF